MRPILSALVALFLCGQASAETCRASWYGRESGKWTATHERFDPAGLTAAHRTYKPGTRLRVTYRGRSVIVRVNDFGPAAYTRRCIDLSAGAARRIGLIHVGVGLVSIEIVR